MCILHAQQIGRCGRRYTVAGDFCTCPFWYAYVLFVPRALTAVPRCLPLPYIYNPTLNNPRTRNIGKQIKTHDLIAIVQPSPFCNQAILRLRQFATKTHTHSNSQTHHVRVSDGIPIKKVKTLVTRQNRHSHVDLSIRNQDAFVDSLTA
jgi:hypothetical protein